MHDGLVANDVSFGELADDAGDVFFFHGAGLDLCAEFIRRFRVLADEHDATGQSVQSIARKRVPLVASFCAHDLNDGVVVVTAGRVDGDTSGFVDDNHVVVFVDDGNGLSSYGGFMSVEGVRDYIAVFDNCLEGRDLLAVENDFAAQYSVFLDYISHDHNDVQKKP